VTKTCSICGQELDPSPLSGPAHARKHRNEFRDKVGRRPRDYDEAREFFNQHSTTTLEDFA
jgi:hypothetical protein